MRSNVYFDTNVFDHIQKNGDEAKGTLEALRTAVKTSKISILLSGTNLEEILPLLESDPSLARAELQLILELTVGQRLLKPTEELLRDDIVSYAKGSILPQPCIESLTGQAITSAILNPNREERDELLTIVRENQKEKEDFRTSMYKATDEVIQHVKKLSGWKPTFQNYWEELAEKCAEGIAEYYGVLGLKVFHMCWPLSDGSSKLIPIDEESNDQIVHTLRLGKADGATNQPLDPGP